MVSSSRTPDSAKHRQKPELDSLSAKRLKNSASGSLESLSHPESDLCDDDSSKLRALSLTPTCSSSCRDFKGPSVASRCQVNGDADAPSADTGAAGISYPSKNHNAHVLSDFVTGWMYLNEQGQMCGPYIQQQLIEGLSTGFLPDELPVYPFMNGALLNPVPLKFFKQYPDHIGTGFTYVVRSTSDVSTTINCHVAPAQDTPTDSVSVMLTSDQQSHINQTFYNSDVIVSDSKLVPGATFLQQQFLSWEERCWLFVDDYGRSSGPHSLSELYGWHQYSYLHSSVMIRHINNSCCPFTLLSLINAWRKQSSTMTANENSSMLGLISGISEEIGTQLHDGIIKAARRSVVDEIIGNVIVDFAATKKAQKQSKSEHGTEDLRSCLADSERSQANAEVSSSSASHAAIIARHDVQTSDNSAKKILEESCNVQNLKSIGSIENFKGANKAICQVLFDHCMQVMWNAVFIEPVTSYALTWRKNKRWTHISIEGVAALDKINTGFQKTADVNTEVRELGTLADKLDCPPGFSSILPDSLMISHSYARAEKSPNPDTQHYDDDLEGMTARVEEELHISGKASMDDFLKIVVEKEVSKAVKCLEDGPNEVAAENSEILCNDNDSEDAASRIHQELGSGHICLDEAKGLPEVTISSVEPALSPQLHSSSNFIGFGLRNLGVSSNLAIKSSTDDPPPVGFTDVTNKPCAQDLCKCLLDQFESPIEAIKSRHAVQSARECSSSNFTGSAFKILGMPVSCVTEDQKTDEPLLLGSGSEIKDVVSSITSNLRPSGLDETIPIKKKFAGLALCRKKLHDDVLREWISTFHDMLKRHALFQEDVITRSDNLPNSTPPLLSHIDRLMERSKSCHSSGPPEVSVIEEITYSRRKKVIKKSGAKPSFLLRDSKIRHQPVDDFEEPKASKNMSCSGTLGIEQIKQKAKALCQKETGSSKASKVGAVNRILSNDHQLSRLSNGRKLQSAARPAQKYCAERRVSHMETASSGKVVKKDKRIKKSSTTSSLKRKDVVDESPSLPPKAPKIMDADEQAAFKKDGRTKLNKSKVPSSCPLSDGCARTSIDGWKWHKWSLHARPAERARVKGNNITTMLRFTSDMSGSNRSRVKGISARTNRVKMRNLLAAVEGAELLKTSQLKTRKKRLRFQRSKIHAWGLVALEPIEPDDFVIEYVGELIRPRISDIREQQYEKMGIGSSYLFRLDDGYVVDATTSGGLARFINHSCEPNCYTKIVSVEGQKRIFIYAKRHISAGEEITYNYKFPLEEKKIPCNCGSKR